MTINTGPHLIIFDCDGTLVDSQQIIVQTMQETFAALGLAEPTPGDVKSLIGRSLEIVIDTLLPEGSDHDPYAVAVDYRHRFHAIRAAGTAPELLYPGARELISELIEQDTVLLGIATGKGRRGIDDLLDKEGWERHFVTIQTADNAPSKPHPGMVHQALSESGVPAGDAVVIGDSIYDMEMALAASVSCFGVAWGYNAEAALSAAGAHAIARDFDHLSGLVKAFQQGGS